MPERWKLEISWTQTKLPPHLSPSREHGTLISLAPMWRCIGVPSIQSLHQVCDSVALFTSCLASWSLTLRRSSHPALCSLLCNHVFGKALRGAEGRMVSKDCKKGKTQKMQGYLNINSNKWKKKKLFA